MKDLFPTDVNCIHLFANCSAIQANLSLSKKNTTCANVVMLAIRKLHDIEALVHYFPHVSFTTDWDDLMAKTIPSFNLIEYRLTDSELEKFEDWVTKSHPTPLAALNYFASKDYKVSLTFVENSSSWCVTVTGKEDAKFNAKSSLTTWSEDPMEGLVMAHFKVEQVFGGGVWKTRTESRRG